VRRGRCGGKPDSCSSPGPVRGKEEGPDRRAPPVSARERRREGRGRGPGASGWWAVRRRERELGCAKDWAAQGRRKREREKGKGRWSGPREKEREEKKKMQVQILLNLNLKLEFK
jgi:hypothetical protein